MSRLAVVAVAAFAVLYLSQPRHLPDSALPTFRTGVDIVELDVTVLDKDRHPGQRA